MWKVVVTSKETIKPSTSTPSHLRSHKLSWLDRCIPQYHVPFILLYPHPNANFISTLKTSLSHTLSLFYPFAGELQPDRSAVHCNDAGVPLLKAIAVSDAPLSQQLDLRCLNTLLPCHYGECRDGSSGNPLLAIQITEFSSGDGITIGICVSHQISDGHSAAAFVAAWAAAACGGETKIPRPAFNAAAMFPPQSETWFPPTDYSTASLVTKRLVFDESTISDIRKSSSVPNLTRVQAVISLVWRCCLRARGIDRQSKPSVAGISVNIRGKAAPPLPENMFGNTVAHAAAAITRSEAAVNAADDATDGESKSKFEEKVNKAILEIDGEKLRKYREEDGWPFTAETIKEIRAEIGDYWDTYWFSSWTRFSLYEADFGWGKPIWMGLGGPLMRNLITLTRRCGAVGGGEGIEACVTLEREEMHRFEMDEEIAVLAF